LLNYFVFPEKNVVLQSTKWSVGREARQSSAKASTAVRICHRPPRKIKENFLTTYSFESENLLKNSHLQGEAYN
jgi:hypothetical protein